MAGSLLLQVGQEKEQVEKELKAVEDQRRRLEVSHRGMQTQLEKVNKRGAINTLLNPANLAIQ
jgi:hypothetical protein